MQSPITNSLFSTGYNLHSISLVRVVPGEERLSQLECEMSNQIAERTIKSHTSSTCKWPPRSLFHGLRYCKFCVEERTLCICALFF